MCTCEDGKEMKCVDIECHEDAVCELRDGIRGCYCIEGHKGDGITCEGKGRFPQFIPVASIIPCLK